MITLYTKPGCPHCVMAKDYLIENEIAFMEVDVSNDEEALAFIKREGHRTVPQLYVEHTLLVEGGNAGLRKLSIEELHDRLRRLSLHRATTSTLQ